MSASTRSSLLFPHEDGCIVFIFVLYSFILSHTKNDDERFQIIVDLPRREQDLFFPSPCIGTRASQFGSTNYILFFVRLVFVRTKFPKSSSPTTKSAPPAANTIYCQLSFRTVLAWMGNLVGLSSIIGHLLILRAPQVPGICTFSFLLLASNFDDK